MRAHLRTIAVALLACSTPAFAQAPATSDPPSSRKQIIEEMVDAGMRAAATGAVPRPFQSRLGTGGRGEVEAYLIAIHSDREGYKALLQALEARAVKQVGSVPGNSGTTSLAMKGLAPQILGLAVETGAITREVDGTTLTFRAAPVGVIKALQNKGLLDTYRDYAQDGFLRYASRVSVAASFDASKGPAAGTFAADEHQLTNWSVRGVVLNQRDPASSKYANLWKGLQRGSAEYRAAAQVLDEQLSNWAAYVAWEKRVLVNVEASVEAPLAKDHDIQAAGGRFRDLLTKAMPELEKLQGMPAPSLAALDAYVSQLATLQTAIDNVYDFVGKGAVLTLDWSTTRDPSLPDLYTTTAVYEQALGRSRKTDLTVNAALNFYRDQPTADVGRFKSFDLTGQLDHPLGAVFFLPQATLTVAARFSHLPSDTVSSAPAPAPADAAAPAASSPTMTATAPQGNIGLVQVKLTVPVKDSGVKIPLSITVSNRTELIQEKDVRASLGITFDLDALLGGLFNKP